MIDRLWRRITRSFGGPEFDLERWFAILGLISIVVVGTASATFMTRFLFEHMLRSDSQVAMRFIESIFRAADVEAYLRDPDAGPPGPELTRLLVGISHVPDMVRANVYGRDERILWSSAPDLIGRRLGTNPELVRAFQGKLEVEAGTAGVSNKVEHVTFGPEARGKPFVETYIPIWNDARDRVIGVVELYRLPNDLFATIEAGQQRIMIAVIIGGLFLYATLFWIVRHAANLIRRQQRQLVEAEALAAIGEMASAVAHGIRNPLASIRSSAELAREEDPAGARALAEGIIVDADRLDRWVVELIAMLRIDGAADEAIDVDELLAETLAGYAPLFTRRGVTVGYRPGPVLAPARGNRAALRQVLTCVIDNALDAMRAGGRLTVEVGVDRAPERIEIRITDSGPGLSGDVRATVSRSYGTTKNHGLGVGLVLSRRIMRRFGGTLELADAEGGGARALIRLPMAG